MKVSDQAIQAIFKYDPATGIITWNTGARTGQRAGGTNSRGYRHVNVLGVWLKEHRLAFVLMGETVPEVVDHINGNPSDNRWANLRPATTADNVRNTCGYSSSGHKGVYQTASGYRAEIRTKHGRKSLGTHATPEDAASAYSAAAREIYGDFANVSHRNNH